MNLQQTRGVLIFEGILFILLGILAIALPVASSLALELFIGWFLIIGGIFQLYRAFKTRHRNGFWIALLSAVLNIGLGSLLIAYPIAGMISLTLLLIFYFLFQGIVQIMLAFQWRSASLHWGWILASGLLSLAMAILIWIGWPGTAFWILGLLLGINMLFFGNSLLFLGLAMPKNDNDARDINNNKDISKTP